jgi:hypothetical protein
MELAESKALARIACLALAAQSFSHSGSAIFSPQAHPQRFRPSQERVSGFRNLVVKTGCPNCLTRLNLTAPPASTEVISAAIWLGLSSRLRKIAQKNVGAAPGHRSGHRFYPRSSSGADKGNEGDANQGHAKQLPVVLFHLRTCLRIEDGFFGVIFGIHSRCGRKGYLFCGSFEELREASP